MKNNMDLPLALTEVTEALRCHDHILVISHVHPDGDAAGSAVAMAWLLQSLGKTVTLYNESGFPSYLAWLALPCPVLTKISALPEQIGLVICVDCGDAARMGRNIQNLFPRVPSVCIDHHLGNPGFGSRANWVDPARAATGEMVALLAEELEIPLQGPLAEAVYTAIVTDTGSFAFGNTTPETMRLTARLMDNGLNIAVVRSRLDNTWSESKMRLWGELLLASELRENGRLAVAVAPGALLRQCGAEGEDLEGFVEQLRRVRGVRVALLLRESDGAQPETRISLRSGGADDVRAVAAHFGGGGHKNAAGATLPLSLEESLGVVLPCIRQVWHSIPA